VISVLVVDDHPVVRAGLANLLRIEDDIDQVTAVSTCAEAEAEFDRRQPDVIVVDYRLPDGDGLTLCRALDQRDWPARVLIFSGYDPQQLIVAAAVAGAMGVLSKGAPGDALFRAVRHLAAGGTEGLAIEPTHVRRASERLDPEDLPVLGLRLEACSAMEIADLMREPLSLVEERIDRIVDTLRPRVGQTQIAG
jgi:DNA-binding NarL/FixJ family response regulator